MLTGLVYVVTDLRRRVGTGVGPLIPNDGLEIGVPAPALMAPDARNGATVSVVKMDDRPTVVTFLSPSCRPCVELVPHLNRVAERERRTHFVAVVQGGQGFEYASGLAKRITVIPDTGGELTRMYQVNRTPLVYVVDRESKIAMRAVPNTVLDLDHILEGIGRLQGSMPWVAEGPATADR